jgi:hypothetical protein
VTEHQNGALSLAKKVGVYAATGCAVGAIIGWAWAAALSPLNNKVDRLTETVEPILDRVEQLSLAQERIVTRLEMLSAQQNQDSRSLGVVLSTPKGSEENRQALRVLKK